MISRSLQWPSYFIIALAESYEGIDDTFVQLVSFRARDVMSNVHQVPQDPIPQWNSAYRSILPLR